MNPEKKNLSERKYKSSETDFCFFSVIVVVVVVIVVVFVFLVWIKEICRGKVILTHLQGKKEREFERKLEEKEICRMRIIKFHLKRS